MVKEIAAVWFESTQKWFALTDGGAILGMAGSAGEAFGQALRAIRASEADFDFQHGNSHSNFWHYVRRPTAEEVAARADELINDGEPPF